MTILPYQEQKSSKKNQVAKMFNNISSQYDFLNHFLSLGTDIRWRKKVIKLLKKEDPKSILDVATGTGDLAIAASKINPEKIVGVDIAEKMLIIGRKKIKKKGLNDRIDLQLGDSEQLPFEAHTFDAVLSSFGVRNFENLEKGIENMYKVLKDNGVVIILEFSKPKRFPYKHLYNFYFKYILPIIGRLFSKDRRAYTYLPESVQAFPEGNEFLNVLEKQGFKELKCIPLTFGISSIYMGRK